MVADSATLLIAGAGRAQSATHSGALLRPGDLLPDWVLADLRTDHAGELGAVCIYKGVLRFAREFNQIKQHFLQNYPLTDITKHSPEIEKKTTVPRLSRHFKPLAISLTPKAPNSVFDLPNFMNLQAA